MTDDEERRKVLQSLAKAKGDLDAIRSNDPILVKKIKEEIASLERELAMLDLK